MVHLCTIALIVFSEATERDGSDGAVRRDVHIAHRWQGLQRKRPHPLELSLLLRLVENLLQLRLEDLLLQLRLEDLLLQL